MSKQLQAYFRTEDEAEGARTTLLTYKTEQLEVSPLMDPMNRGANILVPIIPWNGTAAGAGNAGASAGSAGGTGIPAAVVGARADEDGAPDRNDDWVDNPDIKDTDFDDLKYTLTAKVRDEDYEEIIRKLRANNAFVERFE